MLHTLSRSPYQCDTTAIARLVNEDDEMLLLQDGVLAGIAGSSALCDVLKQGITCYALQEDVMARGLIKQIAAEVILIDYAKFVALTVKHQQQMAW